MRSRFWAGLGDPLAALPPLAQQRLDGWLQLLDDPDRVEEAQRVLRAPATRLPLPPVALPAVRAADGRVLAEPVAAPSAEEAAEPVAAPVRSPLRGAYARRAAARRG